MHVREHTRLRAAPSVKAVLGFFSQVRAVPSISGVLGQISFLLHHISKGHVL